MPEDVTIRGADVEVECVAVSPRSLKALAINLSAGLISFTNLEPVGTEGLAKQSKSLGLNPYPNLVSERIPGFP